MAGAMCSVGVAWAVEMLLITVSGSREAAVLFWATKISARLMLRAKRREGWIDGRNQPGGSVGGRHDRSELGG